jgi:hypothetical protein
MPKLHADGRFVVEFFLAEYMGRYTITISGGRKTILWGVFKALHFYFDPNKLLNFNHNALSFSQCPNVIRCRVDSINLGPQTSLATPWRKIALHSLC